MNVDKKNRNTTLIALCLIFIFGLSALYAVNPEYFEKIQSINQNIIPFFLILTGLLLLFLYFLFCRVEPYFESMAKSIQYPQSEEFSGTEKHTGIIFPVYSDFLENLNTADCIGLLIDEFRKSNKKYRVYHIFEKKNFEDAYYNDYVTELWIIGHGSRGSVVWGNKGNDKIEYSALRILDQKKEFVVQLHCNHGQKQSLKEINGCDGFVSKSYRTAFWNRGYIIEKFNQGK
jgi:hypothetical protein